MEADKLSRELLWNTFGPVEKGRLQREEGIQRQDVSLTVLEILKKCRFDYVAAYQEKLHKHPLYQTVFLQFKDKLEF
jgi:hypothetical protein